MDATTKFNRLRLTAKMYRSSCRRTSSALLLRRRVKLRRRPPLRRRRLLRSGQTNHRATKTHQFRGYAARISLAANSGSMCPGALLSCRGRFGLLALEIGGVAQHRSNRRPIRRTLTFRHARLGDRNVLIAQADIGFQRAAILADQHQPMMRSAKSPTAVGQTPCGLGAQGTLGVGFRPQAKARRERFGAADRDPRSRRGQNARSPSASPIVRELVDHVLILDICWDRVQIVSRCPIGTGLNEPGESGARPGRTDRRT